MNTLIRKKIILHLLDCAPKSANKVADEIGESLVAIEDQLTTLLSENICAKENQNELDQYIIGKDIETFAQLVQEFLSNKEEHREQIEQFITSEYYLTRIDFELVDYVLSRFYLNSIYQADEEKEGIRRILHVSPSALLFALHNDTDKFRESWAHWNQLNPTDATLDWFTQILRSDFSTQLSEGLIADMSVPAYSILYAKLQIRVAIQRTQVSLATLHGRYIDAMIGGNFSLSRAAEDLRAGQLVSYIDPMNICYDGMAFLHLDEFQAALENFDKALSAVQDPIQRAIILNGKGVTFLRLKQYQKAIEYFEVGVKLDSDGKLPELRENKRLAEERLTHATDKANLTERTQVDFIRGQSVPFEETRLYEFKEIRGRNPVKSVTNTADEYAVAFLNREGGRIFWGVRDDRTIVGVPLDGQQRDEVRRKVSEKLGSIDPPISVEDWQLEFHDVYDLQGEVVEDLWVIELVVPSPQKRDVFYTDGRELFVKTEGGKQKLSGPQITEFILSRFQNGTETD